MKPQCETAAQCLKELARVMEQFGIIGTLAAINSKYVRLEGERAGLVYVSEFYRPEDWQFAIAEVEGKPVFIGDELYSTADAIGYDKGCVTVVGSCGENGLHLLGKNKEVLAHALFNLSWNPPKPKTVMVELTVEDAEFEAGKRKYTFDELEAMSARKSNACKLALEKLK